MLSSTLPIWSNTERSSLLEWLKLMNAFVSLMDSHPNSLICQRHSIIAESSAAFQTMPLHPRSLLSVSAAGRNDQHKEKRCISSATELTMMCFHLLVKGGQLSGTGNQRTMFHCIYSVDSASTCRRTQQEGLVRTCAYCSRQQTAHCCKRKEADGTRAFTLPHIFTVP
jgi:hypothetical protein